MNVTPNLQGMVPMEGVEPTHSCEYQILSLARLPIPPHRHNRSFGFRRMGNIAANPRCASSLTASSSMERGQPCPPILTHTVCRRARLPALDFLLVTLV